MYQDADETVFGSKALASSPGMFTSLVEIQGCIEESEQKRLDLENTEG